jgi:crotonobetainyl-CoA:carnitine CoA-transferase CaiB-like acyl-CoA transferase
VVKVEEPGMGDPVRLAPPLVRGASALAAVLLAGVESIALDLKREGARDVLAALLERADVLLESFRPGTLARLGFPPEELAARYPRLVVCSLSGYGAEGEQAGRAGHDLTYQALAGLLAPTARMPAVPVADLAGAFAAALAVVAAVHRRHTTGRGGRVDASLYDAALHANLVNWAAEAGGHRPVGQPLPLSGALPCYNLYRTADGGTLAVACLEHRPEVKRQVQELVGSRTRAEWTELATAHDLPIEPVLSAAEAAEHPQARRRAVVTTGPDGLPRLAYPARLDGERPEAPERLPRLGADTDALLAELGFDLSPSARRAAGVGRRAGLRRALARWRIGRRTR